MYPNQQYQQPAPPPPPFNPTAPQQPYLNLSLNNPPFVPQYPGNPQVAAMAPLVAAALAMEIQNKASTNPLRMFMFNQYAMNNFANDDFAAAVNATLDYMAMECDNRRYMNLETAAQTCVPQIAELLCAVNLRIFPGLQAYIDPQTGQKVMGLIAQFDQMCSNIRQNQMRAQQQFQQPYQNSGYPQGGYQGRPGFNPQMGQGNFNARPMVQPSTGSSSVFSGQQQPMQNPNGVRPMATTKYGQDAADPAPYVAAHSINPVQPAPMTQPTYTPPQPMEALATSGTIEWVASDEFPYIPAYAPTTQELWFKQLPDGRVEPLIKPRDTTAMDYDQHAVGTTFGPLPKGLDLSQATETMARIEEGIKSLNNASTKLADLADAKEATPEITTYVKPAIVIETSENEAWFNGALERLTAVNGQVPDAYRIYAKILDPIVSKKDESETVRNFGASNTFVELREKMNAMFDSMSPALWGAANQKMTALVNRILRQNMSFETLEITSFTADLDDLREYLKSKGRVVEDAFYKYQRNQIQGTFQILDEEIAKGYEADFIGDRQFADGTQPKITFMVADYSLTYLNCLSHELNLELIGEAAVAVTKNTPVIHDLIEGLFKDIATKGGNFDRHLLRTNDGRILEATLGHIGHEFYLLKLIK